jgi:hypothetical protein
MATHISTNQVLDHIKTAKSVSVDGEIFKTITVDNDNLIIGPIKFPLNLFDIGGMNPTSMYLMDSDHKLRLIMLLGEDGFKINHPKWVIEKYDQTKIKNHHLLHQ